MKSVYLKKVFGNSAWMISSKIINIVIGLLVTICVTRYLGVAQRGELANASAIAAFWGFIASFGLQDILIARFSNEKGNSGVLAATGMTIMACGGIASFLLGIISAIALGVSSQTMLYVAISCGAYFVRCLTIYEFWFYSKSKSKYFAISQSVIHILFLIIRVLGVPLELGVGYFIGVATMETVVVYCSAVLCYKKIKCPFLGEFKFDKQIAKELVKLALPMVVMGFATTIYMKVDQIMIGNMIGNTELGLYSVAVSLSEYWYFIPATIYSSFLPVLMESFTNKELFYERLQQFADIMVTISYIVIIAIMLFADAGIELLFGHEFLGSSSILIVYIWSGLFTCLSYSGQACYIINKDTKVIMWINLFGAVLNFIFNLILINIIGSIGAAMATLLEYIVIAFGQMFVLRKKYGRLYSVQIRALFPFFRIMDIYR